MDEAALKNHLIVVDFMVDLIVVLPCARFEAQRGIVLFLSL